MSDRLRPSSVTNDNPAGAPGGGGERRRRRRKRGVLEVSCSDIWTECQSCPERWEMPPLHHPLPLLSSADVVTGNTVAFSEASGKET